MLCLRSLLLPLPLVPGRLSPRLEGAKVVGGGEDFAGPAPGIGEVGKRVVFGDADDSDGCLE